MNDAYADALGLSNPPAAAPASAPRYASAADWKAASAAQGFDQNSVAIAKQELAQAKTPADQAAAQRVLGYTQAKIAQQGDAPAAANDPYADALGLGANASPAPAPAVAAPKAAAPNVAEAAADASPFGSMINVGRLGLHALTGVGSSLYGLTRAAGALAGGGSMQDASDEITNAERDYTYQPPSGSSAANLLGLAGAKYSPLTLLNKGTGSLGDRALAATGSPALATLADVGTNALVQVGVGKGASKVLSRAPEAALAETVLPVAPPAATAPQIPPAPVDLTLAPKMPVPVREPLAPAVAAPPPASLALAPQQAVPGKSASFPGEAAPAAASPAVAVALPPAAPDITPTAGLKSGTALPDAEQQARAKVLSDLGFENSRNSAIQGDNRARAVEFQMAKFDEPAGQAAAQQFANESQTMGDYTRGLIKDAGGTLGTDQGSLYTRGQSIVRPIQALRDWFDGKASDMYDAADKQAQGQPVTLAGFGSTLADPSLMTQPDRVLLRDAASSFAQKTGMTAADDGSFSGTALQAETVRKWLNQQRTNSNGGYVDALKDSMDDDVGQSAGGPIYDQARALWRLRQQTLGDPKGISSLLDEEGTNRAVPFDRVPGNVAKLPQDQFTHIVNTLQNLPPELQGVGNTALGEIKSQFYNKMLEGATETRGGNARPFWNGTSINNVIADNSGKLQALLSPDEMARLDTLRKGGDILSFDSSYPGAAAQAQNVVKRGLMSNIVGHATTAAGAGAGALLGFPGTGAVLGRLAGEKAQAAAGARGALSKWDKGSVTLRNLLDDPQ